jgi:hypothetical protein
VFRIEAANSIELAKPGDYRSASTFSDYWCERSNTVHVGETLVVLVGSHAGAWLRSIPVLPSASGMTTSHPSEPARDAGVIAPGSSAASRMGIEIRRSSGHLEVKSRPDLLLTRR